MIYHVIRCPHCGVKFLLWQHKYVRECGRCRRRIVLGPRFGEMLADNHNHTNTKRGTGEKYGQKGFTTISVSGKSSLGVPES